MLGFDSRDYFSSSLKNQFSESGTPTLNDKEKFYFITALNAAGAWTITVTTPNESYTRSGSGNIQFFHPVAGNNITFTGTSEVSGFYIKKSRGL